MKSWQQMNCALLLIAIVMLTSGCNSSGTKYSDSAVPCKVINAIYTGSLTQVADDLSPVYGKVMPDFVAAGAAQALRQQYGTVTDVGFASSKGIQLGATETVWRVKTDRSQFDMKVNFDSSGKVIDLCFRPTSRDPWVTAMEMGVNYVKQHRRVK